MAYLIRRLLPAGPPAHSSRPYSTEIAADQPTQNGLERGCQDLFVPVDDLGFHCFLLTVYLSCSPLTAWLGLCIHQRGRSSAARAVLLSFFPSRFSPSFLHLLSYPFIPFVLPSSRFLFRSLFPSPCPSRSSLFRFLSSSLLFSSRPLSQSLYISSLLLLACSLAPSHAYSQSHSHSIFFLYVYFSLSQTAFAFAYKGLSGSLQPCSSVSRRGRA